MNFVQFERTPIFFIGANIVIATYLVFSIGAIFMIAQASTNTTVLRSSIRDAEQLKDVLSTQGNYTQSETFAVRFLKESLNKKLIGEKVIDTTTWEQDQGTKNYIPIDTKSTEYSSQWFGCFMGTSSCLISN